MANILVGVKVATDEAKAKLNELIRTTNAATSSGGMLGGVLSGIGAGVGIAGVMSMSSAVSGLVGVMQDAVRGALDDERSIRQLGVSLRDNVPAWDGNTAAVEKAILARQRLGFEDTALRASLQQLVARTNDVGQALDLQARAMDVARFRGIDLAAATDLIGKAFDGNVGALRRAGIAVDQHATAQEALAAVLKSTGGQAEAYAETSLGKMEAAQIRVGESTERLGSRILPALADAMDFAAGAVDLVTTAIDGLTLPMQTATQASWDGADAVYQVGYQAGWATAQVNGYAAAAAAAAKPTVDLGVAAFEAADKANFLADRAWVAANALANQQSAALKAAEAVDILRDANAGADVTARIAATGAWTATSAFYAQAAGLNRAGMGVSRLDERLKATTTTLGGASRAVKDYTSVVEKAFDALRTKVTRAFDAIHEKNLRFIEDQRRAANAPYNAQIATLTAEIAQAEAELKAKQDAARKAELEKAVAEAQTAEELAQAQADLADFLARQAIEAKEAELAKAQAAVDANDKIAEDQVKAEEERDRKQRENFERELAALEKHLLAKQTTWTKANADLLKLLDKYDLDFEAVGKKMGTAYATGYTKGVNSALKSIAAAVARLLGLDEATLRRLASGSGGATTSAAAAATAATGGATATPTTAPAPTTSTAPTAPAAGQVGATGGNTYIANIYAGAFTGTETDARKFAQQMWIYFSDETVRRREVWPTEADWAAVRRNAGV